MKRLETLFILVAVCATERSRLQAQTKVDLGKQVRSQTVDFSAAGSTKPVKSGTVLPGTCGLGEMFFRIDAIPGENLYLCASANTWNQITTGSSGGSGGNFFLREGTQVKLASPGDTVNLGGTSTGAKLTVEGTANETQSLIRGHSSQDAPLLRFERSDGTALGWVDKDGLVTEGVGIVNGRLFQVGNPGDTGASSITVHSGNNASQPAYLRVHGTGGTSSFLFPCTSDPGRWCADSVVPGALYDNPLMTTDSQDVISNKTLDATNSISSFLDWSEAGVPDVNPAAGSLRVYARGGTICWLNSQGNEACVGTIVSPHASTHQDGGSDEIGSQNAAPHVIPKAGSNGRLSLQFTAIGEAMETATQGRWLPGGATQNEESAAMAAKRQYLVPVWLPFGATFNRIRFEVTTPNTTDCDGSGNCGLAFQLWRTNCTSAVATSVVATDLNTIGYKSVNLTTTQTLDPGMYLLAVGTDSETVRLQAHALGSSIPNLLNVGTVVWGYGANDLTGSAATLAFPASCGTITQNNSSFIMTVWEP